jgi:hypothetical protein
MLERDNAKESFRFDRLEAVFQENAPDRRCIGLSKYSDPKPEGKDQAAHREKRQQERRYLHRDAFTFGIISAESLGKRGRSTQAITGAEPRRRVVVSEFDSFSFVRFEQRFQFLHRHQRFRLFRFLLGLSNSFVFNYEFLFSTFHASGMSGFKGSRPPGWRCNSFTVIWLES